MRTPVRDELSSAVDDRPVRLAVAAATGPTRGNQGEPAFEGEVSGAK